MDYEQIFQQFKASEVSGRYITLEDIEPLLKRPGRKGILDIAGKSVENRPIYVYTIGSGSRRILLWSQMHGNESTATKALMDLFNFLDSDAADAYLREFTFCFVPMLNPDGAVRYTRENANVVDLNRDFVNLSQPESRILTEIFEQFAPEFCFNLHDQRTIFGVAHTGKPATISFLSPAFNAEREYNEVRVRAIDAIVYAAKVLEPMIPGQIGRFDDGFNENCVGDNFTKKGKPVVLVESGHYPGDYKREISRKITFIAILASIHQLHENVVVDNSVAEYLIIPQNKIVFFDFGFKNVRINSDGIEKITNFVAHYKEELIENKLHFNAYFADFSNCENYFVHEDFDASGARFSSSGKSEPIVGEKADFQIGKLEFRNGKPVR